VGKSTEKEDAKAKFYLLEIIPRACLALGKWAPFFSFACQSEDLRRPGQLPFESGGLSESTHRKFSVAL
jgi:hypothetical protein